MIIRKTTSTIFFGDASTSSVKYSLWGRSQDELLARAPFNQFDAHHVVILDQTHSAQGYVIEQAGQALCKPYSIQGDYILSTVPGVALAIETADCVPVVILDTLRNTVALIHAGWRGAAQDIVLKGLSDLCALGSKKENLEIIIGPAARKCCYEVGQDFTQHFKQSACFIKKGDRLFFDTVDFIVLQLQEHGIQHKQIIQDNAFCTICSLRYCSYRREGNLNTRQMTIVALK